MTVLRRARVEHARRRRHGEGVALDAWVRPEDDELVETVATWAYDGRGYQTQGEAWLALSAARARERRRVAREEVTTTTAA